MEIVITDRKFLIEKHGPSGWQCIEGALDEYLDILNATGLDVDLVLMDELAPSARRDPVALKTALKKLRDKYSPNYLLILGGDDVIPCYRLRDRTRDENLDHEVLSDTYYADFKENENDHWPEIAVGRLPDCAGNADLLVGQLRRAAAAHRAGGIPLSMRNAGFSTDAWRAASMQVYSRLDESCGTLRFSPPLGRRREIFPWVTEVVTEQDFPPKAILFFNLHGHRRESRWWGEQRLAGFPVRTPDLIDGELIRQLDLAGCVILCEACHGAAIHGGRTSRDSLALGALERGALAFFGCTVTSYAVTLPKGKPSGTSGIDALFQTLVYYLLSKRFRFGDALREAKQFHVFYNTYDEKNILGLVLLGDPMLRFQP